MKEEMDGDHEGVAISDLLATILSTSVTNFVSYYNHPKELVTVHWFFCYDQHNQLTSTNQGIKLTTVKYLFCENSLVSIIENISGVTLLVLWKIPRAFAIWTGHVET